MLYLADEQTSTQPRARPRCKTLVQVDLYNAYTQLGVSPLVSTEKIQNIVNERRKELMAGRRTRGTAGFDSIEDQITKLQAIDDEIGRPQSRARYDERNPQNELLTIQPSAHDRWFELRRRGSLVTSWLIEELGCDAPLPSPECLVFWIPKPLAPELIELLQQYAGRDQSEPSHSLAAAPTEPAETSALPDVANIEALAGGASVAPARSKQEGTTHG